eukprot:8397423-Heterocapsa_arctica.AAC.1
MGVTGSGANGTPGPREQRGVQKPAVGGFYAGPARRHCTPPPTRRVLISCDFGKGLFVLFVFM